MAKKEFPYSLDTSGKKYRCPNCRQARFVRYVNNATGSHLSDEVGKCDRENSCAYHLPPREWEHFDQYKTEKGAVKAILATPKEIRQMEFIPSDMLEASMVQFEESHFALYLVSLFGKEATFDLLQKYFVGYSDRPSQGSTVFWRIDSTGQIRTGKTMSYDPISGKRSRVFMPGWKHTEISGFTYHPYQQCFFGEHLLVEHPGLPVAIVESEKTAVIASYFNPEATWLATGGKHGCKWRSLEVIKALCNKDITLFPDFGRNARTGKTCYDEWNAVADIIRETVPCEIKVSPILENSLPDSQRVNDIDIADMLVQNQ